MIHWVNYEMNSCNTRSRYDVNTLIPIIARRDRQHKL